MPLITPDVKKEQVPCEIKIQHDLQEQSPLDLEQDEKYVFTVSYKSGNVARADVPVPFFMRNDVFTKFGEPEYSWTSYARKGGRINLEPQKSMVLFVQIPEMPVRRIDDSVDTSQLQNLNRAKTTNKQYSIGGCPLECPFDLNEDFEEALAVDDIPTIFEGLKVSAMYRPLAVDDGTWSIRQVSAQFEPFVQEVNLAYDASGWPEKDAPVFSFVDGSAQKSCIALTGFQKKFRSMTVHCMGKYQPEADILKMSSFKKYHDQNLCVDNKPVTTCAHAIYEKLHGEYPSKGNVYMEFLFKEPSEVFDLPPEDCLCKIAIRPLPGDANPSMQYLWKEIQDLERWINILKQYSDGGFAELTTSFLNSTTWELNEGKMTDKVKSVQKLLTQEPAVDLHRASSMEFSDSLDFVLQRVVKLERADNDFTDRLWSVVRDCETVDELQECLQLVFKAVSNKMYRPYILLNNGTEMAKTLSMVMKGEMGNMLKMRKQESMIKAIIECGLVKLFKDYSFSLAMSHLIERGDVDNFAATNNMDLSLENLKKLHCITEVMCLSKERLTLSISILVNHAKKMLQMFSGPSIIQWNQTYHFDVPPHDIRRVMSGLHPIYYKAKMESQTFSKWATTSVIVSPEKYINFYKEDENDNPDLHLRQYYVYVFCENGSLTEQ